MGFGFQDLNVAARLIVAVVGLIAVLAPMVNTVLRSLRDFQFGRGRLFAGMAQIVSLGTFLTVLAYRNSLHHYPPFWLTLVAFVVLTLVLVPLQSAHSRCAEDAPRATKLLVGGLLVYVLAASLWAASLTQFAARHLIYKRVYGVVTDASDLPSRGVPVYFVSNSATLETTTTSKGVYEFLLTEEEANSLRELRAGRNERHGNNWIIAPLNEDSFPHRRDLKWVP